MSSTESASKIQANSTVTAAAKTAEIVPLHTAKADLLNRAKTAVEAGDQSFHEAAELLTDAQHNHGVTQREMAKAVGRSIGWVNALLIWHQSGSRGSPFGPTTKAGRAARHAARRVQHAERRARTQTIATNPDIGGDHDEPAEGRTVTPGVADSPTTLLTAWQGAGADERTQVLEYEGIDGILKLMTESMRAELMCHVRGLLASNPEQRRHFLDSISLHSLLEALPDHFRTDIERRIIGQHRKLRSGTETKVAVALRQALSFQKDASDKNTLAAGVAAALNGANNLLSRDGFDLNDIVVELSAAGPAVAA